MASKRGHLRPLALFLGVFSTVLISCGHFACQYERTHPFDISGISPTLMVVPLALIVATAAVMALAVFGR